MATARYYNRNNLLRRRNAFSAFTPYVFPEYLSTTQEYAYHFAKENVKRVQSFSTNIKPASEDTLASADFGCIDPEDKDIVFEDFIQNHRFPAFAPVGV